MNMTITGTKPEKSRMIATGEEAHNTRRPTRMYQRTSSLHTPSFISQPVVFHPSSFPGEHDPPFRPIPPELEIGPTQLPPLSSILFVQSPSSPRPSSSPLGRFDVYYPPRSGTSPRAHCNQATLLQGQSPFAPNLPAGGERLHGPPVTYAPSLSSSHIDRPQQNFPVPPSRTHPGGQHSYSGQSSRSRPYPSQRLPPEARRLHPPLESPLDQLSPRIRISQPLYNYTPRPQYRSLLYQPLFIPTEIESKVSLDPDGVTVQSHHRAPASLHFQPQNRPVTRGPASSTTPFPDTPFVLIPHSQFPASDVFANCYSPTRLRTGNPWSNMHSSISSYTEPHGSHPDRPRDFEGFASSSEPRDYRRHHSYTGRYTTPPPPPPPLSPVYHTRSTSVQSLDSPPYAQHPTVKLPAKRRKPPDPYSNYANMLGDIINQHKRRKMALQEIYILLQERYADHFPEDDDATGSGNGWRNTVRHALSVNRWFKKQQRTAADAMLDETDPEREEPWPIDMDKAHVSPPTFRSENHVGGGSRPIKGGYWFIREDYVHEVEDAVERDRRRFRSSEEEEEWQEPDEPFGGGYPGRTGYGLSQPRQVCLPLH